MTLQVDGETSLLRNDGNPNEFPIMTLAGIIDEICNRVNDPFNDNYGTRAESLFLFSLYENLSDERFTPFDYHGLVGKNVILTGNDDKRIFKTTCQALHPEGIYTRLILLFLITYLRTIPQENLFQYL